LQTDLVGYNQYSAIFENAPSERTEILLQLDPPNTWSGIYWPGAAAIRVDDWKLIVGMFGGSE
jgi:hypothetical protein